MDYTMIQCNMAHVFLNYYMEAENIIPQILKDRAPERMATLQPTNAHSREK